jgi:hypothetical protein
MAVHDPCYCAGGLFQDGLTVRNVKDAGLPSLLLVPLVLLALSGIFLVELAGAGAAFAGRGCAGRGASELFLRIPYTEGIEGGGIRRNLPEFSACTVAPAGLFALVGVFVLAGVFTLAGSFVLVASPVLAG